MNWIELHLSFEFNEVKMNLAIADNDIKRVFSSWEFILGANSDVPSVFSTRAVVAANERDPARFGFFQSRLLRTGKNHCCLRTSFTLTPFEWMAADLHMNSTTCL